MEHYLQTYTEPSLINNNITITASTSTSSVPSTVASSVPLVNNSNTSTSVDQVMLPLSTGCLTNNLGLPITIVCCKVNCANIYSLFMALICLINIFRVMQSTN